MILKAKIPEKLGFLFEPARYKVAHGGRGSGKSWGVAIALLVLGFQRPLRILCAREIQNSIRESVHKLLSDKIDELQLDRFYHITERSISGKNGTEFIFEGLFRNVDKIKSLEGIDICWAEEAHNISEKSWDLLTPTIRKEDSEIWVTFNPKYEDDATYQKFVIDHPSNAIIQQVNFADNPWFPKVLEDEKEQDKARDKTLYEHKWLGRPVGVGGKIYPQFDKAIHVRAFDKELLAKKANCIMSMDPHSHYYPFLQWMAIFPKNDRMKWPEDFYKYIYAEWPTFEQLGGYYHELRKKLFFEGSLSDIAREIHARDGTEYGIKVVKRFIDSRYAKGSGGWNWSTSTLGIVELFAQQENGGLSFNCPYEKHIDVQRENIKKDLMYNKFNPINIYNEPGLYVDPSCKNTIIALQNHRLEEYPSGEGSKEKESEKYKEPSDTMRISYAGLVDFRYESPVEEYIDPMDYGSQYSGGDSWMS